MSKEDVQIIQVSGKKDIRRLSWEVGGKAFSCPIYLLRNGGVHIEIADWNVESAVTKALYAKHPDLWSFS